MGLGPSGINGIGVETEKGCSGHVQMVGVVVGLEQGWQAETDPAQVITKDGEEDQAREKGWCNANLSSMCTFHYGPVVGEATCWSSHIKQQLRAGLRTFFNSHFPGGFQFCALTCSFSENSCRQLQVFVTAVRQTPWLCCNACGQSPPRSCWASTRWRGRGIWGQGCPLNGIVNKSYLSLIYFDSELGQIGVGDS